MGDGGGGGLFDDEETEDLFGGPPNLEGIYFSDVISN